MMDRGYQYPLSIPTSTNSQAGQAVRITSSARKRIPPWCSRIRSAAGLERSQPVLRHSSEGRSHWGGQTPVGFEEHPPTPPISPEFAWPEKNRRRLAAFVAHCGSSGDQLTGVAVSVAPQLTLLTSMGSNRVGPPGRNVIGPTRDRICSSNAARDETEQPKNRLLLSRPRKILD